MSVPGAALLTLAAIQVPSAWTPAPPLPSPVANNAVAVLTGPDAVTVFSFMGLGPSKSWDAVTDAAYAWTIGDSVWTAVPPVPGPGRLAATAQGLGGKVYLFGGYTVAEDGSEASLPDVDIYDPRVGTWAKGAPIPVPTDDAVSGVWRDSLIYLVSGWHDRANVPDVQVYDAAADRWFAASPIPGRPVFGHSGALAGNSLVYVDGVAVRRERPRFALDAASWRGEIHPGDPGTITWSRLPPHPGPPLYRAASGAVGAWIVFAGGTDNPYNYDGTGYDGVPSEPRREVFALDVRTGRYRELPPLPIPSMDHRGLIVAHDTLVLVGGMGPGRLVTRRVWTASARTLFELR